MKIAGIICEYNPFHLGHRTQIEKIRKEFGPDTAIIGVMSGHFVQRGEPACMDAYTRAAMAAACGVDLVLALPTEKTLSSAEGFARAGVEILDRLGCVDVLSFGCESQDASAVLAAARAMEEPGFEEKLHDAVSTGLSYAAAKQQVLEEVTGITGILKTPNDILGAEYCRALLRRQSSIQPAPIHRPGSYHDVSADRVAPSATAVRRLLDGGWEPYVPQETQEIMAAASKYSLEAGERAMLARLRAMSEEEWSTVAHGSEGLWRKVMKAVRSQTSVAEILEASRSKRYPMTRLMRLLMCAYLGIGEADLKRPIEEVRILALGQRGGELVKLCRTCGDIVLRNPGEKFAEPEQERRCSDLFALFCRELSGAKPAMEQNARIFLEKNEKNTCKM